MRMKFFVWMLLVGVGCARGAEQLSQAQVVQVAQQAVQVRLLGAIFEVDPETSEVILRQGNQIARKKQKGNKERVCCPLGCGATFARVSGVNEHIKRVHQKVAYQRDFKCDWCGKAFTKRNNMTRHKGTRDCRRREKDHQRNSALQAAQPLNSYNGLDALVAAALAASATGSGE